VNLGRPARNLVTILTELPWLSVLLSALNKSHVPYTKPILHIFTFLSVQGQATGARFRTGESIFGTTSGGLLQLPVQRVSGTHNPATGRLGSVECSFTSILPLRLHGMMLRQWESLTPWIKVFLGNPRVAQLLTEFPASYRTRTFTKRQPLVPLLSQMYLVHTLTTYFFNIYLNITLWINFISTILRMKLNFRRYTALGEILHVS
jgi:hypothetical protein